MAEENKTAVKKAAEKAERVAVELPRAGAKEEQVLTVGVNGKNYVLPRGKTSYVPAFVAEELARSNRAKIKADEIAENRRSKK